MRKRNSIVERLIREITGRNKKYKGKPLNFTGNSEKSELKKQSHPI